MDKAKKIITKAYDLEKNKEVALAKEFISLDDKLVSLKTDLKSIPVSIDKKIADVAEEIKNSFPDIPEHPTEMTISNFPDTQKVEITNFPKQEQKAPIVNVPAPQVTVEAPIINLDTSKLEEGIDRVVEILERPESEEIEKVTLVDSEGKPLKFPEAKFYGGGSISKYVTNVAGETINPSTSEKQDEIISAIDELEISIPDGLALETKQDSQIELQTTLLTLTQTLQELTARLAVLGSMANAGQPALRTIPIGSVTTTVTGTLTGVGTLTNFGTGYPATEVSHDINNSTAILANINNVTVS